MMKFFMMGSRVDHGENCRWYFGRICYYFTRYYFTCFYYYGDWICVTEKVFDGCTNVGTVEYLLCCACVYICEVIYDGNRSRLICESDYFYWSFRPHFICFSDDYRSFFKT